MDATTKQGGKLQLEGVPETLRRIAEGLHADNDRVAEGAELRSLADEIGEVLGLRAETIDVAAGDPPCGEIRAEHLDMFEDVAQGLIDDPSPNGKNGAIEALLVVVDRLRPFLASEATTRKGALPPGYQEFAQGLDALSEPSQEAQAGRAIARAVIAIAAALEGAGYEEHARKLLVSAPSELRHAGGPLGATIGLPTEEKIERFAAIADGAITRSALVEAVAGAHMANAAAVAAVWLDRAVLAALRGHHVAAELLANVAGIQVAGVPLDHVAPRVLDELRASLATPLPCAHTVGDLVLTGPQGDTVTKCAACIVERRRRREREATGIAPDELCSACAHPFSEHGSRLPSPCNHGRTMSDAEMIRRACDPGLSSDPAYGCRCMGFVPASPAAFLSDLCNVCGQVRPAQGLVPGKVTVLVPGTFAADIEPMIAGALRDVARRQAQEIVERLAGLDSEAGGAWSALRAQAGDHGGAEQIEALRLRQTEAVFQILSRSAS